jgi:hypothetical protein
MNKVTKKKAKKSLSSEQEFIAWSLTREQIAYKLNRIIRVNKLKLVNFEPNDPRLTDSFCKAIVWGTMDAIAERDDEVEDAECDYHYDTLVEWFSDDIAVEENVGGESAVTKG